MVFSSIPTYLDPSNWQQQHNHQIIIGSSSANPLLPPPSHPPPPPPPPPPNGGAGSIRPGSMSERARLANVPMPETALKCPRCESVNTKFCYFNNYSLSQPRHFCKTCRRYWTRGGALRSVPVGGGCRRNKRSKSVSSKSPASDNNNRQTNTSSTGSVTPNNAPENNILGLTPQLQPLRFMSPLSQFTEGFNDNNMGLNYGEMGFQPGSGLFGGLVEPWRVQPFPFLDPFHGGEPGMASGEPRPRLSGSMLSQMASVKIEDNPGVNLSRQLIGGVPITNDQWINNATSSNSWSDISSFSSFPTSNAF